MRARSGSTHGRMRINRRLARARTRTRARRAMIRSFGKAKRAIRGDDDDGDVRASCDAVTLLALERTFYSSLNFLGVMTLTGVGLTAVGRGGKVPIAFGAIIYGSCILAAIELAVLHRRRVDACRRVDFDGDLRVDDSRSIVVLYAALVLFTCSVDLVYAIVHPLLDRTQAVSVHS